MNKEETKRVIMLPTDEKSHIILFEHEETAATEAHTKLISTPFFRDSNTPYSYHNIHIIDESAPIKEGDWIIGEGNNGIPFRADGGMVIDGQHNHSKIIASTNTSLGLPNIHNDFIELFIKKYNEGSPIDKVRVSYQTDWDERTKVCMEGYGDNPDDFPYQSKLKTDENNCIIVKEVRNSWDWIDVEALLHHYADEHGLLSCKSDIRIFNKWIEDNL